MHFDNKYQQNVKSVEVLNFKIAALLALILLVLFLFIPIQQNVINEQIVRPMVFHIVNANLLRPDSKHSGPISDSKNVVQKRIIPNAPLDFDLKKRIVTTKNPEVSSRINATDHPSPDNLLAQTKTSITENKENSNQDSGLHADQNGSLMLIYETDLSSDYPEFALRQGIQGKVSLRIFVEESGYVEKIDVLYSSSSVLAKHALRHVAHWKFAPVQNSQSQDIVISYRIEGQSVTYN